ncbi:replication protein [Paenibacillus chibensis]|uniref:Replication protein n=1 Tax=Paenibacillus chibensis TaxID=59846 RepID=A0ABU6PMC6_9BACL|nr:replication protein [Paenibacillus chibensis]
MPNKASTDLFVKVPHWVMDYLISADLNMTQFRIMNAVIRYTFGYNKHDCWLSLPFLSELTKCNERQVRRELKEMIKQEIILDRTEGKKRYLMINPKIPDSLDHDTGLVRPVLPDSLDPHIKKDTKEKRSKEKYYINFSEIDDPFINFYLNHYKKVMRRKHVRISEKSYEFIQNQISHLIECGTTQEEWEEKVIQFFKDPLKEGNNRSIRYFLELSHPYFEVHLYNQFNK